MYSLMSPSEVLQYKYQMEQTGVSQVARAQGGFMHTYLKDGERMLNRVITPSTGYTWAKKREAFIKRHLVQYKKDPSLRRRLALIAWAYDPK
jgi:hypothetical protein